MIFEKFRFWSNFRKNFTFRQKFSQIFENFKKFDFSNNLDFFPKFRNISILVMLEEFRFRSKFSKHFDFFENLEKIWFCQIFEKISIWDKIDENFEKCRFLSNFPKKIRFWLISEKFRFWSNILKKFRFGWKFSKNFDFLSKISKNFDFGKIFEKFRNFKFWPKSKFFFGNLTKIFRKFRPKSKFVDNLTKIDIFLNFGQFCPKSKFSENWTKSTNFSKILPKLKFFKIFRKKN